MLPRVLARRERAAQLLDEAREQRAAGRLGAAERTLEEALAQPSLAQLTRVGCYLELGKTLDQLGRRFAAQACYRRVMSLTDDVALRGEARRLYRSPERSSPSRSLPDESSPLE